MFFPYAACTNKHNQRKAYLKNIRPTSPLKNENQPIAAFLHIHLDDSAKSNNEIWQYLHFTSHLCSLYLI